MKALNANVVLIRLQSTSYPGQEPGTFATTIGHQKYAELNNGSA
jgi:hypothetical protein